MLGMCHQHLIREWNTYFGPDGGGGEQVGGAIDGCWKVFGTDDDLAWLIMLMQHMSPQAIFERLKAQQEQIQRMKRALDEESERKGGSMTMLLRFYHYIQIENDDYGGPWDVYRVFNGGAASGFRHASRGLKGSIGTRTGMYHLKLVS